MDSVFSESLSVESVHRSNSLGEETVLVLSAGFGVQRSVTATAHLDVSGSAAMLLACFLVLDMYELYH